MGEVLGQICRVEGKRCEVSERYDETRDWTREARRQQPEVKVSTKRARKVNEQIEIPRRSGEGNV